MPASDEDFELVRAGVERAAVAAARVRHAKPAERVKLLEDYGLASTGVIARDKRMLEAASRVRRDEAILAAHALGIRPPTIATQFDLTGDHVTQVIKSYRTRRARLEIPESSELLYDALEALEAQMERLTIIAGRGTASESAVVGAVRTWRELWLSRLELLQVMNLVSQAPSADARLARARDLLRQLLDALRAEGVAQDVIDRASTIVLSGEGEDIGNVVAIEART